MKWIVGITLSIAVAGSAFSQGIRDPFRIRIRHADPWVVKAMIEGLQVRIPEMSTIPGFAGMLGNAANTAAKLLQDGFLVVNPTDNSLWYYSKHIGA
jgi:hypothetical protein